MRTHVVDPGPYAPWREVGAMTTAGEPTQYRGLVHAGAGTGLFLIQVSALLPGLLATIALCVVVLLALALPLLALGLAAAIVAAPPYVVWRVLTRVAGRRS
jgi:hypothetical protein